MNKLSSCCEKDMIYLGRGLDTIFSFALGKLYFYCCSNCGNLEWSSVKGRCKYKWYKYDKVKLKELLKGNLR